MPKSITPATAARHEAVYLRLAALLKRVDAIAARHPEASVPQAIRVVAEAVLFDARPFAPNPRKGRDFPVAAPFYAALSVQLGAALAVLDGFEAQNTAWREALKCFVWRVRGTVALPVARLRPKAVIGSSPQQAARMAQLRDKLAQRIDNNNAARFDAGYRAGLAAAASAAAAAVDEGGQVADASAVWPTYPRPQIRG